MSEALAPRAPEGSAQIALVPLRFGGWAMKGLLLDGDDKLTVRFEGIGTADWIEITALPRDAQGPVFRRLERCAVRYRGALVSRTPARREEVAALVLAVGGSIDALLARAPGKTIAEALGRSRERGKIVFGRDALRAMLSPEIVEGSPIAEGFALADVYPSSYLHHAHGDDLELILDFRRAEDGRRLLLVVRRRDDTRPAFATTAHLSLTHLSLGASDPPGADAVRALVAFVLDLRDHEGLTVEFPGVAADVAPALLPAPEPVPELPPNDEELNLAINADCEQSCAFCSIKETSPAEDGGDRALARLFADLDSNRRRGVRTVRINGYDPLAYSRILEVLGRARDLGYAEAHVFSPCTRLADPRFCDEVVRAMPPAGRFNVPLYSLRPEVHDKLVGRPGAHALVMRAIDNLEERLGPAGVWILIVATRENLADLAEVLAFADRRGFACYPHLPYPSFESRADRYFAAAPRMTDVADAIAAARRRGLRLAVQGLVPCVVLRRMRAEGAPLKAWLDVPDRKPPLPGTEYRDERFRHRADEAGHAAFHAAAVPCPHASRCVLAPACPGEVLRSYAEMYGLEELEAVSLKELVEAT
ncbi:radical SAM protein [Polyangium aurulentum]|uniref:radical SAM protein n=1 Tax=Polyangium aurulentum TaxID=2567896 RepID=UPI00146F7162|nr:radical SAM protein [Polyangium aurulentum]UQA60190.1 radical SAM protein [Polyangium aurulentum]